MSEHRLVLEIDRRGRGKVEVSGVDISGMTQSVQIHAVGSEGRARVTLEVEPDELVADIVGDVKLLLHPHVPEPRSG